MQTPKSQIIEFCKEEIMMISDPSSGSNDASLFKHIKFQVTPYIKDNKQHFML